MTNQAWLLLGSNMGDKAQMLRSARSGLVSIGCKIAASSAVYRSAPWGFDASEWFFNQALLVETESDALPLLHNILRIEQRLGRLREGDGYASRRIDIDILYYNETIIESPELTLPHPRMQLRKFVLMPLAEISPDKVHPVFGLTSLQMLMQSADTTEVLKTDLVL